MIEERKKQARERGIIEKVGAVAKAFGKPVQRDYGDDAREEGHRYEAGRLMVESVKIDAFPTHGFAGRHFVSYNVEYDGKTRFGSEDDDIKSYIPGDWESELNKVYERVPVRQTRETEEQRADRERREISDRWGL